MVLTITKDSRGIEGGRTVLKWSREHFGEKRKVAKKTRGQSSEIRTQLVFRIVKIREKSHAVEEREGAHNLLADFVRKGWAKENHDYWRRAGEHTKLNVTHSKGRIK